MSIESIRYFYNQASECEIQAGLNWYNDARSFAIQTASEYNLTIWQVCNLISLLSPQKQWLKNKSDVIDFLNGDTQSIFSTKKTIAECDMVIDNSWSIPENRLKTYAFASCIYGNENYCVIDRHAYCIFKRRFKPLDDKITPKRYKTAEKAYIKLAKELQLKAYELQAITWVTYKRIVNR